MTVLIGFVTSLLERRETDAVAKYRMPAQMSLVLREDVSDAKSPRSMQATLRDPSRVAASSAMPHPVAYSGGWWLEVGNWWFEQLFQQIQIMSVMNE